MFGLSCTRIFFFLITPRGTFVVPERVYSYIPIAQKNTKNIYKKKKPGLATHVEKFYRRCWAYSVSIIFLLSGRLNVHRGLFVSDGRPNIFWSNPKCFLDIFRATIEIKKKKTTKYRNKTNFRYVQNLKPTVYGLAIV